MRVLETESAPDPAGAYSQGIVDGDTVYVSGQVGVDPETGDPVTDDLADETRQTLRNLEAVLDAADASLDDAVKATVYLTDIDSFDEVNEAYGEFLDEPYPARAAVEVGDLVSPFNVEIELVATLE